MGVCGLDKKRHKALIFTKTPSDLITAPENKIIEDNNENEKQEKKEKKEKDKDKEIYDMILDFSNFDQLKRDGWKISWPKDGGLDKYNICKESNNIIIGILGNKYSGKSFLLRRIIGIIEKDDFINNSRFLTATKGISVNFYLPDDIINIISLDIEGKDSPLLYSNNYIKNSDSCSTLKDKSKFEYKNIAIGQRVSEIVLSDFVIKESEVLIKVLEHLSFSEQEMLMNLINQLKSKNAEEFSFKKTILLVIHNLMNFTNIETIENYIKNTLLKSLTFDLRYGKQPMIDFFQGNIDDRNKFYYVQKTENEDSLEIFHIIVGNDFVPEIREEYNEPAIRFIRKTIKAGTARKTDLVEDFKNFIIQNSQKYLSGSGFQKESLEIKKNKNIPEAIILNKKYEKNINLKGFFVDSKGINNFISTIEPKYSTKLYKEKNEDKYYIKVIFEIFGKIEEEIRSSIKIVRNQHVITIDGKITDNKNINDEIVQGNLKYSEFYFQIIIDKDIALGKNETQYYNIVKIYNEQRIITKNEKLGIYRIKYPIKFIRMS